MQDYSIHQILQRYELTGDYDLLYAYEQLNNLDINRDFIFSLLDIFENNDTFSEVKFESFSLEVIIDYIHRTHRFYLTKKLLEIEQSIHTLLRDYADQHPLLPILHSFYREYTDDLTAHIRVEEKEVLPHVKRLITILNGGTITPDQLQAVQDYSLQLFMEEGHHDTEKDLSDVRNIILEYHPPKTNQTPYRILVSQLEAFQRDLNVHALIEDHVLIPRALSLEKKVKQLIKRTLD